MTAVLKEIYFSLNWRKLFTEEQKGKRGIHDLLYIDQYILKEVKNRRINIAMAWIDYRKAYDMVTQTIVQTIRIYRQDIRMEFGIEKYAILVIKRGERKLMNGIQLPNQDTIKSLDGNESYKS